MGVFDRCILIEGINLRWWRQWTPLEAFMICIKGQDPPAQWVHARLVHTILGPRERSGGERRAMSGGSQPLAQWRDRGED